jgi:protein tyrosine phosphatase (PTP) superfamily phosphohydrolase (DUF442 family)
MIEQIYHFLALDDRLLTSGMPTAAQLADAARVGVQTVINLAMPDSERALPDEPAVVESLGMEYVGIPVKWDAPTRSDLDRFMDDMDTRKERKLLVHCQANYRVSGFIALYRVLRLGWDREDALKDLRRIWNPAGYPVWQAFLDDNLAGSSAAGGHA